MLVLQGGEYGMTSSFYLLQQAIAVQQTGCAPAGDLVQCKKDILEKLMLDMTAHYEQGVQSNSICSICSADWVAGAYDIYCIDFHNYLLRNYATYTKDLRFHALDSFAVTDSVLVKQGTSHLKAGRVLSGEAELLHFLLLQLHTDA